MKTCRDCGMTYDSNAETNCPAWSTPMKHSDWCPEEGNEHEAQDENDGS